MRGIKNLILMLLVFFLSIGLVFSAMQIPIASAASQTGINNAIIKGLAYLNSTQAADGHWSSSTPVACTAMAVLAFENDGHLAGNLSDPYHTNVQKGLDWLFSKATSVTINVQPAGNPDANGNGYGIGWLGDSQSVYETPMVLMAIVGSRTPNAVTTTGPANVTGRTYYDIVRDIIDWIAWAQTDSTAGTYRGGWRYSPNSGNSDNSVSQWPTLGLMTAELWGVNAPSFVKTELAYWITADQNLAGTPTTNNFYGVFDYYPGQNINSIAETATGIMQLTYIGVDKNDSRIIAAQGYINRDWLTSSSWRVNLGNFYAMYAVMKAARLATPTPIKFISNYNGTLGREWYNGTNEYADQLVTHQATDGHWDQWASVSSQSIPRELGTAWALLILEFIPVVVPYDLFVSVVDPRNDSPAVNATVLAEGPETRSNNTGNAGIAVFEDIQAGGYEVSVTAPEDLAKLLQPQNVSVLGNNTIFEIGRNKTGLAKTAMVYTTDSNGTYKVTFNLNETVVINWIANVTINITVRDKTNATVASWNNQTMKGTVSFMPSAASIYRISITSAQDLEIAYGTIQSIPEVPLGTVMAACIVVIIVFGRLKLKRTKP